MRWVHGLWTNGRKRSDRPRFERIRRCGWLELTYNPKARSPGYRQNRCRDRACPSCARDRSRQMSAKLRRFRHEREKEVGGRRLAFVTLTHRKALAEGPGEATTRLLGEWRRLWRRAAIGGAWRRRDGAKVWRPGVAQGYVRAVECVWSAAGRKTAPNGATYVTRHDGWHAHLHVVLELADGVSQEEAERAVVGAWLEIADGEAWCQRWQPLTPTRIGQVAKYITKPFELPDHLAPTFFREMGSRRLIESGGTWKEATRDAPRGDLPESYHVPQGIHLAELVLAYVRGQDVGIGWSEKAGAFFKYSHGGDDVDYRTIVQVAAKELLPRVLSLARARSKDGGD